MLAKVSLNDVFDLFYPFSMPTNKNIFVYFDAGGIVCDLDFESYKQEIINLAKNKQEFSLKNFNQKAHEIQLFERWSRGFLGAYDFIREFYFLLGYTEDDLLNYNFPGILTAKKISRLVVGSQRPRILRLAKALKNKGYGVGILSNSVPWHESVLESFGSLERIFDVILFSHDLGCEKPHVDIYNIAEKEANIWAYQNANIFYTKNSFYFVDDTPVNVKAALDFGWNARLAVSFTDDVLNKIYSHEITNEELINISQTPLFLLHGEYSARRIEYLFENFFKGNN